ncbi:MAG: hypothetical protein AVDCRST_MAG34-1572 [uncultured Nocardioidaceae bacterium]|uniref:Lipoprotein n=1 Tax=uncultured Nocardioidaceae bacterium TaxID=253824 RepID=A0A6J4L5A0_9ACTN|nr:MAG: hypothetical protein AVDCRST_MAG34-1572 [uncultured Nocardioidaceae bacterium]
MKKTVTALCATLLISLSACGNSEDDKAKENIKASVLEGDASVAGGAKLTDEQAECFANGMVDDVGVADMQKYKLLNDDLEIAQDATPTDMSQGDADATADVIVRCVDMKKLITDQINTTAETDLDAEQAACVDEAINEDAIKEGLSATFQGKSANPMTDMQGALLACISGGGTDNKK